ncbi:MAG: hypothetical protein K0S77_1251 [Pseudomonas sp.]|jgi:hypothetical protein|nr:hypothetical protein [Pseudomonas sp.]
MAFRKMTYIARRGLTALARWADANGSLVLLDTGLFAVNRIDILNVQF